VYAYFVSLMMLLVAPAGAAVLTPGQLSTFWGLRGRICHNFYAVQEGALYRSAQLDPETLALYIQALDIKTVINLRGVQPKMAWWLEEQEVCRLLGVHFYNILWCVHYLPSRTMVLELLDLFDHVPRPILIHCIMGADRTGEAAALWVRAIQNKSKQEALRQQSIKYHHLWLVHPAKRFFQEIWQGRQWLVGEYESAQYSSYADKP
jgi:protein tyrosine/serine phosphatase